MNSLTDEYYSHRVEISDDPLWQVGKTVNGCVVDAIQVEMIVKRICWALEISSSDMVLDVGAGNGLLTNAIAQRCSSIVGIERNDALYRRALAAQKFPNTSFLCNSLSDVDFALLNFNKVFLYEVVQHLSYRETATFVRSLFKELSPSGSVFLGGIPSELKKWSFYKSFERRREYFKALADGSDIMGNWYHPEFFEGLADSLRIECQIIPQDEELYTSYYRFDCLLKKPSL